MGVSITNPKQHTKYCTCWYQWVALLLQLLLLAFAAAAVGSNRFKLRSVVPQPFFMNDFQDWQ